MLYIKSVVLHNPYKNGNNGPFDKWFKSSPLHGEVTGSNPVWTTINFITMYICKYCGKEFEKQQGWASHQCKCKMNPDRDKAMKHLQYVRSCNKSKFNIDDTIYLCKYCGKECKGKNSLTQHEIRCSKNENRIDIKTTGIGFIKYNQACRDGIIHHPHYGKTKYTSEAIMKASTTRKQKYISGESQGAFLGKKHSPETKEKMRKSALRYLQQTVSIDGPRYNKRSIEFIKGLNERFGWNLQHAENGGEFEIGGYYVDGYDANLNIVFEYDEPRHYIDVDKSILTDKDIERQNYIIEKLGCEFYRYNEQIDFLYKV